MGFCRRLEYVAPFDGSCEDILAAFCISSTIRKSLKKRMGYVCLVCEKSEYAIRLVDRIKQGDRLCIYLEDDDIQPIPKWQRPVDIVYEDEDLAVVDKSAGVAVIAKGNHYGRSLVNCLANVWGDFVYRPVNRLDRDTSGLMIVAKNRLAHSILAKGHIERKYIALCQGTFVGNLHGMIDRPIKESDSGMKREISQDGKRAVTEYSVVRQYDDYFAAEFVLRTGRTHQIRVHISDMGYPICCDRLYAPIFRPITCPDGSIYDTQTLHSCELSFVHPIDGRQMQFESKAPFLQGEEI